MHLKITKRGNGADTRSLDKDRITIGRAPCCGIVLESPKVSRLHAVLERTIDRERYVVSDLSSAGGTILNGEPVAHAVLQPGDTLLIGDFELTLEAGAAPRRTNPLWDASAEEMASQEPTNKTGSLKKAASVGKPLWATSAEEMETQEPTRKTAAR